MRSPYLCISGNVVETQEYPSAGAYVQFVLNRITTGHIACSPLRLTNYRLSRQKIPDDPTPSTAESIVSLITSRGATSARPESSSKIVLDL